MDDSDILPPSTPREALDRLRYHDSLVGDTLVPDQIRIFQSMPLGDRLEFLFRTQLTMMLQLQLVFKALGADPVEGPASPPRVD